VFVTSPTATVPNAPSHRPLVDGWAIFLGSFGGPDPHHAVDQGTKPVSAETLPRSGESSM